MPTMAAQNYYRVSVKGIVIDEQGRILLVRESDGWWDMIGGGVDHGEEPLDALVREIKEETGLTISHVSPAPCCFVIALRRSGDGYAANVVYEITLEDLNFTPSDECQELRFFTKQEIKSLQAFPNVHKLAEALP